MGRRESPKPRRSNDHRGVLAWLAGRFKEAQPASRFEALTPAPGAYLLVVALTRPLALLRPALKSARLGPGHYLYAGSISMPAAPLGPAASAPARSATRERANGGTGTSTI